MSKTFWAASAVLSFLLAGTALADCAASKAAVSAAAKSGDLAAAERAVNAALDDGTCGPDDTREARAVLARALLDQAAKLRNDPKQAATVDQLVEKAAKQRVLWEAALQWGDLQVKRRAYVDATNAYHEAVGLIELSKDAVPKATITYLARRTDETRQLAALGSRGVFVKAPANRAATGQTGGSFSAAVNRGPVGEHVPTGIEFVFDSDQFTPNGTQAADEMVTVLKERRPVSITITGHTDRIGAADYNLELSKRRANKVAAFLKANGITAGMTVVGKGFNEPRVLTDPSVYTKDDIDALNRRVEFDWKDK